MVLNVMMFQVNVFTINHFTYFIIFVHHDEEEEKRDEDATKNEKF